MAILQVEHLTKDYGGGKGIFDLSFSIEKGEVFGDVYKRQAFEDEFLAAGLDIFVVADEAELMHLVQHGPLPVAHVFRMPVGIVFRRVLGDAGDHRTLCRCV